MLKTSKMCAKRACFSEIMFAEDARGLLDAYEIRCYGVSSGPVFLSGLFASSYLRGKKGWISYGNVLLSGALHFCRKMDVGMGVNFCFFLRNR